jgi:hypothetical protein
LRSSPFYLSSARSHQVDRGCLRAVCSFSIEHALIALENRIALTSA